MNELEFWAAILNSWPLAFILSIVIVSLIYGKQIQGVLNRLRSARLKLPGVEADISSQDISTQIDEIQQDLTHALPMPEVPQQPNTTEQPKTTDSEDPHPQTKPSDTKSTNIIDRLGPARDIAQADTRSAILIAWDTVEQRLREAAIAIDPTATITIDPTATETTRYPNWLICTEILRRRGHINRDLARTIRKMRSVRNQAAHPRILETDQGTIIDPTNPSYEDAISYIDLAQTVTALLDLREFLNTLES